MAEPQVDRVDVAAFSDGIAQLLRQSTRGRRRPRRREETSATLEAIISAAGAIIDEQGVEGLRIAEVCERAGVGSSSIYHLFGDRDGLVAATLTDRFDRTLEGSSSIQQLSDLMWTASADEVAAFGRSYLTSFYTDAARERARWARVTALGAACHRPPLIERLGDALQAYVERMRAVLALAQVAGHIDPRVDPVAAALFGQAHQFGLLANRFDRDPVPVEDWETVVMRAMGMLGPNTSEPRTRFPGPSEAADGPVAGTAAASADPGDLADPPAAPDQQHALRAQAVVDLARAAFTEGGAEAVSVAEVRAAVGVSAGWFHRTFGDREGLIDEVRLTLYDDRLGAETDALVRELTRAASAEEFVGRMLLLARDTLEDSTRSELWFRVEVLSALDGRPGLRRAVAEIDARHTASLTAAIADAQGRGVIATDLAPRAVARFAQGMHFGFLLSAISGLEPTAEQWRSVFERVVWGLTPEAVHSC
jgi:AcrR family transcriptional regulator